MLSRKELVKDIYTKQELTEFLEQVNKGVPVSNSIIDNIWYSFPDELVKLDVFKDEKQQEYFYTLVFYNDSDVKYIRA